MIFYIFWMFQLIKDRGLTHQNILYKCMQVSEQFNQDVTHLVTCTAELINYVRGNGRNFAKFSEKKFINIANWHDENGPGMKKYTYDNKVYTFIYIT